MIGGEHPTLRQPDGSPILDFWSFCHERQAIWKRRSEGLPRDEWTADPALRERFYTNIFRELDPGTDVAVEILSADAPAWVRLWNLVMYRRFNREDTWRDAIGFWDISIPPEQGGGDLATSLRGLYARLRKRQLETKAATFTDAHQVYPLPKIPGPNLTARTLRVMLEFGHDGPSDGEAPPPAWHLAQVLLGAETKKQAFRSFKDEKLPGIQDFLGWQLTMDCTYGPDPIVRATDDWAPITTGARVGMILHLNWPTLGVIKGMGNDSAVADVNERVGGHWPILPSVPPRELEQSMRTMVATADSHFRERGLDLADVAAPGHPRMTCGSVEHALCEWQKYVGITTGLPHSNRFFKGA